MDLLDLTLATPEENLALDEALLELVDSSPEFPEILRLWEMHRPVVVVGRSSRVVDEVNVDYCQRRDIPILRRPSGGAAVVLLPGCLIYSLVLRTTDRPELRGVDRAHQHVLAAVAKALHSLQVDARHCGISDLACDDYKVSGNSLRIKQQAMLYHGTLLYSADLTQIEQCLRTAPRQPAYRRGRTHREFVVNLPVAADRLKDAVARSWHAERPLVDWPTERVAQLAREKYSRQAWNMEGRL